MRCLFTLLFAVISATAVLAAETLAGASGNNPLTTATTKKNEAVVTVTVGCGAPQPTTESTKECVNVCDTNIATQAFLALHVLSHLEREACRVNVFVHSDPLLEHACQTNYKTVSSGSTENPASKNNDQNYNYVYSGNNALPKDVPLFAGSEIDMSVANKSLSVFLWIKSIGDKLNVEVPIDLFSQVAEKVSAQDVASLLACLAGKDENCSVLSPRAKRDVDSTVKDDLKPVTDIIPNENDPPRTAENINPAVNGNNATDPLQHIDFNKNATPANATTPSDAGANPDLLTCNLVAAREAEWAAFATILSETGGFGNTALFLRALITRYEKKARIMKGNNNVQIRFGEAPSIIESLCRKITKVENEAVKKRISEYVKVHRAYNHAYLGETESEDILVDNSTPQFYPESDGDLHYVKSNTATEKKSSGDIDYIKSNAATEKKPSGENKSVDPSIQLSNSNVTRDEKQPSQKEVNDKEPENQTENSSGSRHAVPGATLFTVIRKLLRRGY